MIDQPKIPSVYVIEAALKHADNYAVFTFAADTFGGGVVLTLNTIREASKVLKALRNMPGYDMLKFRYRQYQPTNMLAIGSIKNSSAQSTDSEVAERSYTADYDSPPLRQTLPEAQKENNNANN